MENMSKLIGSAEFQVMYDNNTRNNITSGDIDEDLQYKVLYKKICDVMAVCTLVFIMLSMGTDIKFKQVLDHIKRPVGVIMGMTCQFILMPLLGFSLSQALSLSGPMVLGLMLVSCCPGGALSNIFSYFMDGDVPLSVTMTSLSTLLALGFMPFNLWLYGHWVNVGNLVIPYKDMATSLAFVTIPAGIGILLKWKYPKFAGYVTKVGSIIGLLLVIFTIILYIALAYPSMLKNIPWRITIAAFVMPFTGFILGYLLAKAFKRNTAICKTIAVESSIQNIAIALAILAMSPFSYEEQSIVILFPSMYGITMTAVSVAVSMVYQIWKRCFTAYVKEKRSKLGPGEKTSGNVEIKHELTTLSAMKLFEASSAN